MRRYEQVKITEISIKNFRSIVNMNIDVEQLNMFVGLNDVGKSNVLKALNLFFNNETDYNEKFAFESDFSQLFPQKSKKAKEIVIKIIFEVPQNYKGHGEYVWEKRWRKDGLIKDEILTGDGSSISSRSKVPNLLRKMVYRYVPAVKSKEYYKLLLIELYKAVSAAVDSPLKKSSDEFSHTLREYTASLSRLIFDYMGMQSQLSLPQNFSEIFETLMFQTKKENSKIMVPLSQRGDGIQARHIPIILKYIADEDYKQSTSRGAVKINTLWGFEEPENGLELLKAFEMADQFVVYSEEVQIFLTTHSPAFYAKKEERGVKIIYVKKNLENDATIAELNPSRQFMDENMGLMPLVTPYIVEQNRHISEIRELWENSPLIDKPSIMVEGKSDKLYLEMAIKEISEPLKAMLDKDELRIVTREDGAGTTLIKNWVLAWLHSGNKSKMLALFDKDAAGNLAAGELKENHLYKKQNSKSNVRVIQLEPSEEIIELYRAKLHIPYEVEHLLSTEVWDKAIKKRYVTPRNSNELLEAYKGNLSRDKSVDSILEEKIIESRIRETIADYNPHEDKKIDFCNMVVQIYQEDSIKDIFKGFQKTIGKIEQFLG